MAGTIGIKIANGDFYPILTEGSATVKKRLVLTTVHDRQESVQIDLYRSVAKSMLDAQYIGSLVVESIKPRPRGEPSVEMVISCDADGAITADACDLDAGPGGGRQILNVSLKTAESSQRSDFDLDGKQNILTGGLYEQSDSGEEDRKFPWLIMAAATLFVILVIAMLWFFFLGGRDSPPFGGTPFSGTASTGPQRSEQVTPPPPPPPEPVAPPPPPPEPIAPPPPPPPPPEPAVVVTESPKPTPAEVTVVVSPSTPPPARPAVKRQRPPAPVSSYKVPAVIPKNGVVYQIRWGDTLWDISAAFYRNPWLYPRIARHNNIRNPDHIIAGRNIRIPPRN